MIREEQFIRLFVRYEPELRGFAMTLMLGSADAEDVLQEACVAMWKRIKDLDNEAAFRSWAYSFVRFTALNQIRKRNRSPLLFSEALIKQLADESEEEAERSEAERLALAHCLEKLPARQIDLVRRYYASASVRMADIARDLQKPVAGLYKALERTRDALRSCMTQYLCQEGFDAGQRVG